MRMRSALAYRRWPFIFSWQLCCCGGPGGCSVTRFNHVGFGMVFGVVPMGSNPRRVAAVAIGALSLALLPWVAHALGEPLLVTIVTRMMIYGLVAASLDLILGIGGMV